MKVLILGGSHFVGRALVETAMQGGHDVTMLNRGLSGHLVDEIKLIRADRTSPVAHTTISELLDTSCQVTESSAELVWFTPEEIDAAGIAPWTELPIWVPPAGELAGLHDCDVSASLRAGLRCRPIRETIQDTWDWLQREGPPVQRVDRPVHGLNPQREAELIDTHLSTQ
jgi:2'-hydroxyisoflavone reductase